VALVDSSLTADGERVQETLAPQHEGRFRCRAHQFTITSSGIASNLGETPIDALSSTINMRPERRRACRRITLLPKKSWRTLPAAQRPPSSRSWYPQSNRITSPICSRPIARHSASPLHGDALSTFVEFGQITRLDATSSNVAPRTIRYAPTFLSPFDPLPRWHTTILHFAAAAIEIATGLAPTSGYVCFGLAPTIKAVRLDRYLQHMAMIKEVVLAHRVPQSPPLELNSHCPICQFKTRCRNKAIEADNLTLVSSIPPKERRKLEAKGITTVTQLSYTYRPRHKRRAHATPRPANT